MMNRNGKTKSASNAATAGTAAGDVVVEGTIPARWSKVCAIVTNVSCTVQSTVEVEDAEALSRMWGSCKRRIASVRDGSTVSKTSVVEAASATGVEGNDTTRSESQTDDDPAISPAEDDALDAASVHLRRCTSRIEDEGGMILTC